MDLSRFSAAKKMVAFLTRPSPHEVAGFPFAAGLLLCPGQTRPDWTDGSGKVFRSCRTHRLNVENPHLGHVNIPCLAMDTKISSYLLSRKPSGQRNTHRLLPEFG